MFDIYAVQSVHKTSNAHSPVCPVLVPGGSIKATHPCVRVGAVVCTQHTDIGCLLLDIAWPCAKIRGILEVTMLQDGIMLIRGQELRLRQQSSRCPRKLTLPFLSTSCPQQFLRAGRDAPPSCRNSCKYAILARPTTCFTWMAEALKTRGCTAASLTLKIGCSRSCCCFQVLCKRCWCTHQQASTQQAAHRCPARSWEFWRELSSACRSRITINRWGHRPYRFIIARCRC